MKPPLRKSVVRFQIFDHRTPKVCAWTQTFSGPLTVNKLYCAVNAVVGDLPRDKIDFDEYGTITFLNGRSIGTWTLLEGPRMGYSHRLRGKRGYETG